MTEIKNETGTKKKLLIPVVVLMLLAVGLTGAAYAYSSTLTNSGNSVDAGMLSIDLKLDGEGDVATDAVSFSNAPIVTFTDNFGYNAQAEKSNYIAYEISTGAVTIVTYQVNIAREADNDDNVNLTVSSDNLMAKPLWTVSGTSKTVADLYDVKFQVDSGAATALGSTAENLELGAHTVVITFTKKDAAASSGYTTAARFTMGDPSAPTNDTASDWVTAIAGVTFNLQFAVTPYVAP